MEGEREGGRDGGREGGMDGGREGGRKDRGGGGGGGGGGGRGGREAGREVWVEGMMERDNRKTPQTLSAAERLYSFTARWWSTRGACTNTHKALEQR